MSKSSLLQLLPLIPNTIRRYHGTGKGRVDSILKEGLKVQAPLRRSSEYFTKWYPKSKAVYTTALPVENYFDPTDPYEALVVLDLPKDWYREAPRQSINLENGYKREYMNPKSWPLDDTPDMDWYTLMPIQQGGHVDIFDKDIPPEFIREVLQPNDKLMQLDKLKTQGTPISWDDIDGFSKFRPYWK